MFKFIDPQENAPGRQPARKDVTVEQLVSWLGCPGITDSVTEDALKVSGSGEDVVSLQDEARAERLAADPEFHRWLTSKESGHLLVQGNYDQASQISGLSIFSSALRRALWGEAPRCIPLLFFCAQSGPPRSIAAICLEELETVGHTMVRSLIYQLVHRLGDHHTIAIDCYDIVGIKAGSITCLCNLLSHILSSMPSNTAVWCLIDGVEFYEQKRPWFDVKLVLEKLARFANPADNTRGGASVRMLLTTPTSMARAPQLFANPQVVSLAAMAGEQRDPDRWALRRILDEEVEKAHGYWKPQKPRADLDDFEACLRGWRYLMSFQMPVTWPGERDARDLPVSRYVGQAGYEF
ncbi:hypothetical protein KVR01_004069 [Diaporthe batatas]|uniref:uncharacterized protein n=1 Tax=Diaporthe batatas TaxID=748121 RepID=UPI001D03CFB9|nr:uncharacterized protein KVR01_004069 [Diaporthe batatas]KAG8165517.1 hypothetical protein KVR01_004069 [Diaporthe batatas]